MLHILNRCELATVFDLEQCNVIEKVLDEHQIEYHVKVIDRSSPSIFNMDTREHRGTLFQNMAFNWRYIIYVKRSDLAAAQDCIRM